MSFLREIGGELAAMFVGDMPLALCVLILVGGTAVFGRIIGIGSLAAGAILLIGALLLLVGSVRYAAAERRDDLA